MSEAHYDVIIIGGRSAGATLAIRLARQQLNVLVVDRATFPSLPNVASSPIIYESTMRLLDELGIPEDEYTLPGSRANQLILDFVDNFSVIMPTSALGLERSYVRGLDRAHFDNAIWKHLEKHAPYVTTRQGFAVTDVLRDSGGRITGIVGKEHGGQEQRFTADLVVGADGRYSFAARKFGAKIVEERNEFTTGGYEAQWEGVLPYAEGMSTDATLYNTARGFIVIFMPISHGRYHVIAYMRSQDMQLAGETPEEFYLSSLKRIPKAWARLQGARRISELKGMRPVENAYREAFGPGWALVGDAFSYKDPLDGQGIYDAMLEAKMLAEVIGEWKRGKLTWEQAGAQYKERAWAATYPMFKMTTARVKREMHSFPPRPVINTLIRWMVTDPAYQAKFLRVLARVIEPSELPSSPTPGMILRGILRSFRTRRSSTRAAIRNTGLHPAQGGD